MRKKRKQMPIKYKFQGVGNASDYLCERSLDLILSPGCYVVEIEHTDSDVGLPFDFCGQKHYIVATLIITDNGAKGKVQKNRLTGQALVVTLQNSLETKIYIRTRVNAVWSEWRSLACTGMYNSISTTDELLATVESLVTENVRAKEVEKGVKRSAVDISSLACTAGNENVTITGKSMDGEVVHSVEISAATTEKAGVMTAEDKQIVDNLEGIAFKSTTLNELDFVDTNKNCVVAFADGHIKTKNFDSRKNAVTDDEKDKLKSTGIESTDNCDFAITDEQNNAIIVLADGHIKTKNFDSRNGVNNTKFIDRDIYALGDSTTQGAGSGETSVLGSKSWFDRLVTKIQFRSYRKLAANGTVTMKQEGLGALSSQINYLPVVGNPIILVMIGTNDINKAHTKGDANSVLAMQYDELSETASFAEAFRYNFETIKRRLPNAEIIAMMPLSPQPEDESDAETYRDIERTICRALSIPVLEVRNECGISKYCNYGFAQVAEDEIENAIVFMADALHPNNAGYERIANYVAIKLNKYIQ